MIIKKKNIVSCQIVTNTVYRMYLACFVFSCYGGRYSTSAILHEVGPDPLLVLRVGYFLDPRLYPIKSLSHFQQMSKLLIR